MSDTPITLDTLQAVALGAAGGVVVGRLLGIGVIGTALGLVAGATAGYLFASVGEPRPTS